jgi:hypothetical protein
MTQLLAAASTFTDQNEARILGEQQLRLSVKEEPAMTTPAPTAHRPQAASGRSPTPAEQGKRRSRHADPPSARAGRLRCPAGPEARPRPLWPAGTGIVAGIHRPVIELSTAR